MDVRPFRDFIALRTKCGLFLTIAANDMYEPDQVTQSPCLV